MSSASRIELLAGTWNPGKVREIESILRDMPVDLRSLRDFTHIQPVEENGRTYQENSALKALSYARWTKLPTIADDSGLEVVALDGRPGVLSARFGGAAASDRHRIERLLTEMEKTRSTVKKARFVCCVTLAGWKVLQNPQKLEPVILNVSEGQLEGEIITDPRGKNGFGYDPVFVPNGHLETLAELPPSVKNRISHRAKALLGLRRYLEGWLR